MHLINEMNDARISVREVERNREGKAETKKIRILVVQWKGY